MSSWFLELIAHQPRVITIGNFDGCHRGHQLLISRCYEEAKTKGCRSTVVSFSPRPEEFFRPSIEARSLFTPEQKLQAIREMGVEELVHLRFDKELSQLAPQAFFNEVIHKALNAKSVIVGENFHFGHRRAGKAEDLKVLGESCGISSMILSSLETHTGHAISSSRIRESLLQGDLSEANHLLGRSYSLEGTVVKGDQRGRVLGFPTLNLSVPQEILIPKHGVYAGWILTQSLEGESPLPVLNPPHTYPAVIHIGPRPTVDGIARVHIEGHVMGTHLPELYGHRAGFYLVSHLRDVRKFSSVDDLKAQLVRDTEVARGLL